MLGVAAYRAGEKLQDMDGCKYDYTRKEHIEHTEIIAPANAPSWATDRQALWNAVEASEKRKDSRLAREVELSLPRELSPAQRVELVRGYVRSQFVDAGMIADIAIHNPKAQDGQEQPHAHILLTLRRIDESGFAAKRETAWNSWGDNTLLKGWRETWAQQANDALEAAGHDCRIDHRSLEEQKAEAIEQGNIEQARKLDREPTISRGITGHAREVYGYLKERAQEIREISSRNEIRQAFHNQFAKPHTHEGTASHMQTITRHRAAHMRGYDAQELAAHLWGREVEHGW